MPRRADSAAPHVATAERFSHAWSATCRCGWRGPDHVLDERGRKLAAADAAEHVADPHPLALGDWQPGQPWGR